MHERFSATVNAKPVKKNKKKDSLTPVEKAPNDKNCLDAVKSLLNRLKSELSICDETLSKTDVQSIPIAIVISPLLYNHFRLVETAKSLGKSHRPAGFVVIESESGSSGGKHLHRKPSARRQRA